MSEAPTQEQVIDIKASVASIVDSIDQEREREIITRRFGLYERKETLEQIGELLGITRERVRQLEKAILIRIKMSAERGDLPDVTASEKVIIRVLSDSGRIARVQDLTDSLLGKKSDARERAHI
ncbi:MAG: RNA polymerase sigma factor, partial [Candidatus Saccharibacteria bacterium GW2011_GWC2_48_9]